MSRLCLFACLFALSNLADRWTDIVQLYSVASPKGLEKVYEYLGGKVTSTSQEISTLKKWHHPAKWKKCKKNWKMSGVVERPLVAKPEQQEKVEKN